MKWPLLAALLGLAGFSHADSAEGHLLLKAKAGALNLPSNSLAAGMSPDDWVRVTLPGHLYHEAIEVALVPKTAVRRFSPEVSSASDYSAFKAADPNWIAANFTHKEQAQIKANFSDKMIMERTRAIFDGYTQKTLVGQLLYKDAVILFVNYHDWPVHLHAEVYVKEATQWKRTNALSADETFDVISAALKTGDIEPRP
jgi:hypothetical protein